MQNKEGDTISVADLTDLPSDSDFVSLGPEIAAIEGEIDEDDNPIIRDMKAQCSRDQGQDSTETFWLEFGSRFQFDAETTKFRAFFSVGNLKPLFMLKVKSSFFNLIRPQLDYCVGESWKSKDHTMCKFCVSWELRIEIPATKVFAHVIKKRNWES